MDADVAPGNDFTHIPLAGPLRVEHGGDAFTCSELRSAGLINDALLSRRFAAVRHCRVFLQNHFAPFDIDVSASHAPPLADAFLHDVALDRAHPGVTAGALRPDAPIEKAAVRIMLRLLSRRPLLFTPFVLNAN